MNNKDTLTPLADNCCPACGLLCDDIFMGTDVAYSAQNSCAKRINFYNQADIKNQTPPSIGGMTTDLNSAIQAAISILKKSKRPLFAGLGTEVQGIRAIIRLAAKTHATLDHMHSEITVPNTLALQNSGWQTTTLTEIKNRATLILAIGTDITTIHPRFFEKLVWNKNSMLNKSPPEVIYLGELLTNTQDGISPEGKNPTVIFSENNKLPEILNALNTLVDDNAPLSKRAQQDLIGGVSISTLTTLIEKIKASAYTVMVWASGDLQHPHAELTIQSITQLISKLNLSVRVAGLALNAGDGDTSVNSVCTWLHGYPVRSRFNRGQVEYDVHQFSTKEQIKTCDALLWISTFNPQLAPSCNAPSIVIGHPNMKFERPPDVFIPVGIPGLDHAGTLIRMDYAVSLPLKKLRENTLPSLSDVIQKIDDGLS